MPRGRDQPHWKPMSRYREPARRPATFGDLLSRNMKWTWLYCKKRAQLWTPRRASAGTLCHPLGTWSASHRHRGPKVPLLGVWRDESPNHSSLPTKYNRRAAQFRRCSGEARLENAGSPCLARECVQSVERQQTREEVRGLVKALRDLTSNKPPQYGVYPDYEAGVVRMENGERIIANARWGLPSPAFALKGRNSDPGITNVRNTESPHWRRWLGPENRCLVPFTSFAEPETIDDGKKQNAWFALDESRPIAFFAGIWVPQWKSIRKVKEGETVNDLFAFLTTTPNKEVAVIHPKAMPVILTKPEEWETWLHAARDKALELQRPLPNNSLVIVARGTKTDGERPREV